MKSERGSELELGLELKLELELGSDVVVRTSGIWDIRVPQSNQAGAQKGLDSCLSRLSRNGDSFPISRCLADALFFMHVTSASAQGRRGSERVGESKLVGVG